MLMCTSVQQFSNWNCTLGMYIDDALMGRERERETYFHVISDQCNYPRSAMIAVRGLALQGVAQSPTIMLIHCSVCEAHMHWLCLCRFNHTLFELGCFM
jgi:hypothetical protein